jgi:hypothetical protein
MRAAHNQGLLLGEVTLTETLLIEVAKRHPWDAIAIPFTPSLEAVIGADWEWWLTDGHEWLGILVQAKSLNISRQKYLKLNYKPKRAISRQLETHVENATRRSVFPLLCFYNYTGHPGSITWNCQTYGRREDVFGCSVADARVVDTLARGRALGLRALSRVSFPLLCLVGCFGFMRPPAPPTLPHRAGYLLGALGSMLSEDIRPDPPRLRSEPPNYIRRLLSASPDERRPIMEEIRREIGVSGGIFVLKEADVP